MVNQYKTRLWDSVMEPLPASSFLPLPPKLVENNHNSKKMNTFDNQLIPDSYKNERRKECPMSMMTDSYKATHLLMYPDATEMRAYGEFRAKFYGMPSDKMVFYGTRYYMDNFINQTLKPSDISSARMFLKDHFLCNRLSDRYFYKHIDLESSIEKLNFLDLLEKNGNKFPVKIEAMPEGSVIRPHIPVYIITASAEYSRLCTFLETILTMLWYPSCVATLSRHTKDLIEDAYNRSVGADGMPTLNSRLHDFGFRGCTSVEQSVIGGCAHLLNFEGSDTMSACYYAQYMLNDGVPVAKSVAATEHSVMTSWETEVQAVINACKQFPGGIVSSVMDAYDYEAMLDKGLKQLVRVINAYECTLVVRPDSGDPVEQVLLALKCGEAAGFELRTNEKGFKVFSNYAVLQGDGINYDVVKKILDAVLENKYSACNVAFGMGGGLLQKVNRDTMSFATKLCYMKDKHGKDVTVMKKPAGNTGKISLGGKFVVLHEVNAEGVMIGPHFVCTEENALEKLSSGSFRRSMKVVYDGTESQATTRDAQLAFTQSSNEVNDFERETFKDVRDRVKREWKIDISKRPVLDPSMETSQRENILKIENKSVKQYENLESVVDKAVAEAPQNLLKLKEIRAGMFNSPDSDLRFDNASIEKSSESLLRILDRLV